MRSSQAWRDFVIGSPTQDTSSDYSRTMSPRRPLPGAAARAQDVLDGFSRRGEACWEVGRVIPEPAIRVLP